VLMENRLRFQVGGFVLVKGQTKFGFYWTISNHGENKMFYVCQIRDQLLGRMDECSTLEEAVELAKKIILENGEEVNDDVEQELIDDNSFLSLDGEWSVCIGTVG
jgi:hypothetical protein